jgi:hypothetical protein
MIYCWIGAPKRDSIKLFLFIVNRYEQNDDQRQSSQNVEYSHSVVGIVHNCSFIFIIDKLKYQAKAERSAPKKTSVKFTESLMSGPINSEANPICPMSRRISEKMFNRSEVISI